MRSDLYFVVELKVGKFKPKHPGQLNFHAPAIDDILRQPLQAATVGIPDTIAAALEHDPELPREK